MLRLPCFARFLLLGALLLAGVAGYFQDARLSAAEREHVIFRAIRQGDIDLLKGLLRQGTPADLRSARGQTPLMTAAIYGTAQAVQVLLDHGADPNAVNQAGATALIYAAPDLEKVRLLLEKGGNINARSKRGNTPLIVAAAHGDSTPVVKLLLRRGATATVKNQRGASAFRNAARAGNLSSLKHLHSQLKKLHHKSQGESKSPWRSRRELGEDLTVAAEQGHEEVVKMLLDLGADPNTGGGRRALHRALLAQKPNIVQMLLKKNAKLDRRLQPGGVPSMVLAAYTELDDVSVAKRMIEQGADLTVSNNDQETVLTWARKRGHPELIDVLTQAKAPEGRSRSKNVKIPQRKIELTAANESRLLRESASMSIALLQHSSDVFLKRRENCISCHHQNLPAIAVGWARDRGLPVDEKSIERMVEGQLRSWRPRIEPAYQLDRPVPVAPRFIGYGLLGFAAIGYAPDEVTQSLAHYLAAIQMPDGHWTPGMLRPPLGGGDIVATVLAMRSLQLYPLQGRVEEMSRRVETARRWLAKAKPQIHQQRVFKLLGLAWAGIEPSKLDAQVQELLSQQQENGGWKQLSSMKTDAWATGQTLVALHIAGGLSTTHPAYQKGLEFLLRTQFDDGSWYVPARTWPFQSHFDSEFPHDHDQWVSAPATAWAAMAMVLAISPDSRSEADSLTTAHEKTKVSANPVLKRIDFVKQIQPLFERSCVGCHSGAKAKGNFRMTRRDLLLRGGESGQPAIKVGKSEESQLIQFVSDRVEDLEMPPIASREKFPPLTKEEVDLISKWIQQGAEWPKGVVLKPVTRDP